MALEVTFDTKLFEKMLREHPRLTHEGLRKGFKFYRHDFERSFRAQRLSGQSSQSLGRRTGQLAAAWRSAELGKPDTMDGMGSLFLLGTSYARAHVARPLGTAPTTITPKRGKYLTIPVGPALKPGGAAKFSSIRQDSPLRFIPIKGGRGFIAVRPVKKSKARQPIRWVLVRKVVIPARLDIIRDMKNSMPKLIKLLNKTLGAIYGKWK